MNASAPYRVLVVGGGFGRVHARAVLGAPHRYLLAGVAGRGGAASRELAVAHAVPYHDLRTELDAAARTADVVCLAVGSAVQGGDGTRLAEEFVARGVHVLQEHPVHPDEMVAGARAARRHGVQHMVNLHYRRVRPVQVFVEAARRLAARHPVLFVDAASPVHVLHPLVDVLAAALGGVRPWAWHDVLGDGPLRTVVGTFAGVPTTLRVQNQLDPADRDNQALLWHRVALGTTAGVLTLADTHGPVLWSPRWHAARDAHHRLVLEGPGADLLARPSTVELPGTAPTTMAEVVHRWWPEAVLGALDELTGAAETGADPLRHAQLDLTTARIWAALTARLGPPQPVTATVPPPVGIVDLVPGRTPSAPAEVPPGGVSPAEVPPGGVPPGGMPPGGGYSPEAEFYDLVAARRAASVAQVVQVVRGADPCHGPVVEIGAGTGLLTAAVARALPTARVLAAEPDPVMRAVLTSRVVRDPLLRRRVTVTDGAAPHLDLPDRIGAAVLCGVVGHLDPGARAVLWRRLAARLAPGAPLVVELLSAPATGFFGPVRLAGVDVGRDTVEWSLRTGPAPDGAVAMTSTWQVLRDGEALRTSTAHHSWTPVDLHVVAAESGLDLEVLCAGDASAVPLGVLRRRA